MSGTEPTVQELEEGRLSRGQMGTLTRETSVFDFAGCLYSVFPRPVCLLRCGWRASGVLAEHSGLRVTRHLRQNVSLRG
jgi:hypothetical protein